MGLHASTAAILEQRYRRLLRWYPAAHRDRHGEEMIGVLLAAARPGQHRPGLTESANLLWGGARIWLRRLLSTDSGQAWTGSLAALSVLVPLIWTVKQAISWASSDVDLVPVDHRLPLPLVGTWVHAASGPLGAVQLAAADLAGLLPPAILAVLVLLRLRRTALGWLLLSQALRGPRGIGLTPHGFMPGWLSPGVIALELVALAALLAAPRPLPRLTAISRPVLLLAGVIAVTSGAAATAIGNPLLRYREWHHWQFPEILAGIALMIALTVVVPGCRRVMLLLAIPVLYFVADAVDYAQGVQVPLALAYLPLAVLVVLLALVLIRRSRPRTPVTGSAA
jgi:hypothetical protein